MIAVLWIQELDCLHLIQYCYKLVDPKITYKFFDIGKFSNKSNSSKLNLFDIENNILLRLWVNPIPWNIVNLFSFLISLETFSVFVFVD